MHLIVGLGNPGAEYAKTRHNAGFMLADLLAKRWRADWNNEKKFQSRVAKAERNDGRVVLCEPQTFMNLSGAAVRALYERFAEERRRAGEGPAPAFESFRDLIGKQTERIRAEKGAQAVDFRLETKNGKVSLKARIVK